VRRLGTLNRLGKRQRRVFRRGGIQRLIVHYGSCFLREAGKRKSVFRANCGVAVMLEPITYKISTLRALRFSRLALHPEKANFYAQI
jgi:hypothetical protein